MSFDEMMKITSSALARNGCGYSAVEQIKYVIKRLIESLRQNMLAGDNTLQQVIMKDTEPYFKAHS
ncbi:MAG: hypothetical protein A2V87_09240 [Deltaproteobacteria bacterium RBG_16_58_17]|nr:MAG: hypothetical protein A2V87_09240 [Deltaproteobacteria bacterium RBG_16_58_17]